MTEDPFRSFPFASPKAALPVSRRVFLRSAAMLLALRASRVRGASLPATTPPCLATSHTSYPPMLEAMIAKLDPAFDDFPSEQYAEEIQKVLDAWSEALCKSPHDSAALREYLSEGLKASSLLPSEVTPLRKAGPLRSERRSFHAAESTGRDAFLVSWSRYAAAWTTLETVELQIYGLRVTSESPLRVETDLRCDLVGTAGDKVREQRVGAWRLSWQRDEQKHWIVERWTADPEVRSRLTGPGFREVTASCLAADTPGMAQLLPGIDHWRTSVDGASGIDVYGNHGIAVGDIDGSGFDSFYVCQPSGLPNRLYRNRGDGTFEDITENSGTGILDGTASALFVDFLNRGKQDLLVVRTGGPLLFSNMGDGRFEPRPDAFQFARAPQGTFTSAAVADCNRDGFLDVYLCVYSYYQGLNQYQFPSPFYDAQNGPPNYLFRNRGDGTFEDVTASSGMDQNNNRYSFAVAWCDYDNDGWPDLYVANDFGRKNLYRNNGDGTFTDIAAQAGVEDYGPGMSTCWLDYDNDGRQDIYVANMWLPEGKRITETDRFLPGVDPAIRALYQKGNMGNSMYRNAGSGAFKNTTEEAGSSMGRWSWSCAAWDFDHDGWPDLYVANGFVSGPNSYDLQSFFWRQVAQRSLSVSGSSQDYEMAWNAINELVRSDYSWSGYQRNVFFANNHDGSFSDVSGVLGLDLRDDCRAYALSDFDHDGRPEFVLKNRTGPQVRIMRNDMEGIGNSITLRLTGHTSNRDAIGATVTIEAGAARQTKFVSAGSGFASQHSKELFFGIGENAKPISISVLWPNGQSARYENLPVNHRIEIDEGQAEFKATPYASPRWPAGASPTLTAPPAPATVSTWLVAPLFGPDLLLTDLKGKTQQLSALRGRAVLLTFVRTDCGESRAQLAQLQKNRAELSAAGVALYIVCVQSAPDRTAVEALAGTAPGLSILLADEHAAGAWNIQYRYLFDRRRDMSLPLSFLMEPGGAIVRVYQGVAEPQAVMQDCKAATATPEERFARALPFPGPYYGGIMKHDYLTYGTAFVEFGYVDAAAAAFQHVIDANPLSEAAWFNLGTIYLNKKDYPHARRFLGEAVRLNPQDADAWNNLGMMSGEQANYDEALDSFKRAAEANPNHLLAVDNMMRIYRYQGRPADAEKTMKDLIARAPDNANLHLGLAMTLVAQNDLEGARGELETSLRLRPRNPEVLNNLGAVLLRMSQPAEALQRFEESRQLAPDFDRPCINAALVYKNSGQPARARQVLQEFLARHPDNADVRSALDKLVSP